MGKSLFLIGFMASGKTSIGRKLAKAWNMNFIDLDKVIEEQENMIINQIFAEKGEEYFRKIEREILQHLDVENAIIATGGGTACFFENMAIMKEKGRVIYIEIPTKILIGRLKQQKSSRPLVKDLTDKELVAYVKDALASRSSFYQKADITVDGTLSISKLKTICEE